MVKIRVETASHDSLGHDFVDGVLILVHNIRTRNIDSEEQKERLASKSI